MPGPTGPAGVPSAELSKHTGQHAYTLVAHQVRTRIERRSQSVRFWVAGPDRSTSEVLGMGARPGPTCLGDVVLTYYAKLANLTLQPECHFAIRQVGGRKMTDAT
jgi:hypothetical protein